MTLLIASEAIPLKINAEGTVQVGGTRVPLDTVVSAFIEGVTPEEMVQQFPSLKVADVYVVNGYYLRCRPNVEAYVRQRREQAGDVRAQNESRFDPLGVRDRLSARQTK